ncbi:MFS transporter [Shinella daejeonensis]|uniref:MFS transporter n=1 Tax=Shinella daejeonensis TaxID=659017 RepID=UPI0020C7D905|nr:MFS transporter [Shinella daejeonensis]MCP8895000.1 MFS transporter [Shinella daejeonensis]
MNQSLSSATQPRTYLAVLVVLALTHLLNDLIQSLIPAVYPIIKDAYALDFVQIGIITFTFQIAGSLLQPVIGYVTDRRPMPYSTIVGMTFTLVGLASLGFASSYEFILVSVALIGIGSAIFHPEATRMARHASGGRQGLAQGIFQVGGQAGGALGPLLAAFIIVPHGQTSLAWFTLAALLAMVLMTWTAGQQAVIARHIAALKASLSESAAKTRRHSKATVLFGLTILTLLMFSKIAYTESFRSFYTFYLIERFGVSIPTSQIMLFVFLVAQAVGVLIGGIAGDRIGRYRIIWISVLGPLPFTLLLPYADFFWTGVLTVTISLIIASAFASILIYAIELMPERIGLIGGLFYGLNFGLAGIAAAILGGLADSIGIENVYWLCAFLPLAGLLTWFLPRIEDGPAARPPPATDGERHEVP